MMLQRKYRALTIKINRIRHKRHNLLLIKSPWLLLRGLNNSETKNKPKPMKNIIAWIVLLFSKKKREQTKAVISHYQELINEYELIMKKKSSLPKADRDRIVLEVWALIKKGHIKIEK